MAKKTPPISSGKFERKVYSLRHNFAERAIIPSECIERDYWTTAPRNKEDMESLRLAKFRTLDGVEVCLDFRGTSVDGCCFDVEGLYGVSSEVFEIAWERKVGKLSGAWHSVGMVRCAPQPTL